MCDYKANSCLLLQQQDSCCGFVSLFFFSFFDHRELKYHQGETEVKNYYFKSNMFIIWMSNIFIKWMWGTFIHLKFLIASILSVDKNRVDDTKCDTFRSKIACCSV